METNESDKMKAKKLTIRIPRKRWCIKNRFVGFVLLAFLSLVCLVSPKMAEAVLNDDAAREPKQ